MGTSWGIQHTANRAEGPIAPASLPVVPAVSGRLGTSLRAVALALALFVVTAACVDGPVVEQAEPSQAQGVSAAGDASAPPADETFTTADTSPTTTKPKPVTTTSEPEPADDEAGESEDAEDGEAGEGEEGEEETPGGGDGSNRPPDYAAESIAYVNQRRSDNGTGPLQEDPELTALAEGWAKQISSEGNLYHNPNLFQDRPPGYRMVGENVAYNSVAGNINDAWWNSDGHRANILNESYTHIGVAFVQDDRGVWWAVQVFAG